MFKFDINQGYDPIDIYKPRPTFFGFSWYTVLRVKRDTGYFVFTVLPFVLTSALFVFTKVMNCLLKFWRINSVRIVCFLDDGLAISESSETALRKSMVVKNSNFIVNNKKSIWHLSKKLTWYRIDIDLEKCFCSVPFDKILDIKNHITTVLTNLSYSTARKIANFVHYLLKQTSFWEMWRN